MLHGRMFLRNAGIHFSDYSTVHGALSLKTAIRGLSPTVPNYTLPVDLVVHLFTSKGYEIRNACLIICVDVTACFVVNCF